jgi:O-antigen polymerase superfamily protein
LYIACVAGVVTYIGAGFFNDSVVAISPIFWAMLGIAISKIGENN